QKRMTPEEIQDLMPPVKRCNETAGADTGRRKSSPEQTVVSDGHSKALKKAPTARESQQATAVDLARRLQQKQTPSIETERVKPAEQSQSSAKKPEAARDGAGSGSKKASTGAQSVETSETEARRSTPSQAPIISKKASQEVRNLHSVNDANSVYTRQKSQSSQSRRAPAGFNPLNLSPSKYPTLCRFGRNLLAEAQSGRIAPVIQRDHEIAQLIDILNKRRSNNPILIGEAGVGKTAIIEGLALRMAQHEAPPSLNQHTIIALDHGAMLCGTQLRGAVQERIHAIKSEVRNANGHIILFLDEIHSWLSSSPGDPNTDAALELKIALSRGELMCIGAATPAELRRAFDSDPAFERRFDFIEVKAPDAKTSIDIIRQGIIRQYATHHGVEYEDTAIVSAVKLADRYIQERALPDKALSVLDRAGSFCVRSGDTRVDTRHVAHVISQVTEVPVERLLMTEKQKLMQMETLLGRRLVGHEANVAKMSQVIRRNHAGFGAQRPIGSFLFLGPTGVGKTEAAKVLADFLFGSDKNIVRFDMSEYMESHAVAKLIGAPAGYVGFDDGGLLTEALRKRPYQIVLFDEIEKAHPDIMNILLQILDEGRLTDAKGRHVNFSNAVIIMTSNLGAQDVMRATRKGIGFDRKIDSLSPSEAEQIILKAALARFSPELWNRIEEKLVFHPLSIDQIERIASLLLLDSGRRLFDDKHIRLHFDEASIVPYLLSHGGFDPNYGARPMRKTIQSLIESRIAEWILAHDALPDALHVNVEDETVIVRL
ncbi:MAG: ATP-dependent Clp protease ATP-binding subunit, partial [Proteobacteria bacterium]|nr:ATP-dependent Clp protease ATP-binding subunit [Pseudomonadota bacterium]